MAIETHELFDGHASLSLAEDLTPDYSTAARNRFVVKRTSRGRLVSAWNHIEYALSSACDTNEFDRYESLDCARSLVAKILGRPEAHIDTHLESLVLAAYLPAFYKRAFGGDIGREDCAAIYESLAGAFTYIRPLEHGTIPSTLSLEMLVLGLSARTRIPDYLLYPTSPREEASELQAVNHDSYFVADRSKLPIQQKLIVTEAQYAEPVTMLTLLPLVERASKKAGYIIQDEPADELNNAVALMVAEASGETLEKHEKLFLDTLTRGVVAHYREAAGRVGLSTAA